VTAVSARYAVPLALLLLAVLLPAWTNNGPGRNEETCANPAALFDLPEIRPRAVVTRPARPNRERFSRRVSGYWDPRGNEADRLEFSMVRFYGLSQLMLDPTSTLTNRLEPDWTESETLDVQGAPVPVSLAYQQRRGTTRFAIYTFLDHENRPTRRPVVDLLHSAFLFLTQGRHPMTMLLVAGETVPVKLAEHVDNARKWMQSAVAYHQVTCAR
jgi:hypothetical protein